MPAALKWPTLDEVYKSLRDLDYPQVDERLAVMLDAILQLEVAEIRKMTVGRFVTAANEVTMEDSGGSMSKTS